MCGSLLWLKKFCITWSAGLHNNITLTSYCSYARSTHSVSFWTNLVNQPYSHTAEILTKDGVIPGIPESYEVYQLTRISEKQRRAELQELSNNYPGRRFLYTSKSWLGYRALTKIGLLANIGGPCNYSKILTLNITSAEVSKLEQSRS